MTLANASVEEANRGEEFGRWSPGAACARGQGWDPLEAPEWPARWVSRGQEEGWAAPGGETLVPLDGVEIRALCLEPTEAPDWP